jgi:pimeloyl-ACP methyl ester carboxylesterase
MTGFRESYAHLADGRPIYYFEEGEGPSLLFLRAATSSADGAHPMIESMRDRFHCIALDRVGYRRSGTLSRATTLEEQIEGLATAHSACSSDSAWVFGHSVGAVFATAYALAWPDRVRGLVLMEPPLLSAIPAQDRHPAVATQVDALPPLLRDGPMHEAIAVLEHAAPG